MNRRFSPTPWSPDPNHSRRKPDSSDQFDSKLSLGVQRAGGRQQLFAPIHYTASYKYPLLVWLHNDGFNQRQINDVMPHVSLRNYVGIGVCGNRSVDPAGTRYEWHDSDAGVQVACEAVSSAVHHACSEYSIHTDRIILAGYQAGGTMALRLAMMAPNRFSAAISLGGRMPSNWQLNDFHGLRSHRLPMLWQWGAGNPDYTQSGLNEDCTMAMQIGSQVEVRQYPGNEEMDTVVLSDMNEWIMRTVVNPSTPCSDHSRTHSISYSVN